MCLTTQLLLLLIKPAAITAYSELNPQVRFGEPVAASSRNTRRSRPRGNWRRFFRPGRNRAEPAATPGSQMPALVVCRAGRVEAAIPAVPKASQPTPPRRLRNSLRMARTVSALVKPDWLSVDKVAVVGGPAGLVAAGKICAFTVVITDSVKIKQSNRKIEIMPII